jgi:isopenicillin-N N-acyltransferase-like protein
MADHDVPGQARAANARAAGAGEYPRIVAAGPPRELGLKYGRAARDRIRRSIKAYTDVFDYYAHMSWADARRRARAFVPAIRDYDERCLSQLEGMAEGAGLEFEDLLALNLRTEVMFGGTLHGAASAHRPAGECTAVVALPEATDDGHTLLAQNWDWLIHTRDTTVVLEARPDDRPAFVTVVEAGLLAKTGMNENGVGVATNTVISDRDAGKPGVPYHVVLRSLLEAESVADALSRLYRATRSSSANYLVASGDGLAMDAECLPGGPQNVLVDLPRDGLLVHANHFVSTQFKAVDVGLPTMPDSLFRSSRLSSLLKRSAGAVSKARLQKSFTDHAGHPFGVCSHEDVRTVPVDQYATIASLVMDLTERRIWLASGTPCSAPYVELTCPWEAGPRE